jgi:hypothetical protein
VAAGAQQEKEEPNLEGGGGVPLERKPALGPNIRGSVDHFISNYYIENHDFVDITPLIHSGK